MKSEHNGKGLGWDRDFEKKCLGLEECKMIE